MAEKDRAKLFAEMVNEISSRAVQHHESAVVDNPMMKGCSGEFIDCENCGGLDVFGALSNWIDSPDAVIAEMGLATRETVDA